MLIVLALADLFSDAVDIPWWVYVMVILFVLWDVAYNNYRSRRGW